MAHRAVLCAALGKGTSHIRNREFSKDLSATLSAAGQLCAKVRTGADGAVVEGLGSFLPVIVAPSHATGKSNLVEPMMIAAVAAGADGLEVEVHYDPRHAWSDGAQCLTPDAFAQAMAKCRQVAWAIGRDM